MTTLKDKLDLNVDYYALIGVSYGATDDEIRVAYRKKARDLHPDRHKDEEKEKYAKLFEEVGVAYRILTDPVQKVEYDKKQEAKKVTQQRNDAMSDKRKQQKLDLEERERNAKRQRLMPQNDTYSEQQQQQQQQQQQASIKDQAAKVKSAGGYDALLKIKQQLLANKKAEAVSNAVVQQTMQSTIAAQTSVKAKWKKNETLRKFTTAELRLIFSKFGKVESVVMRDKKRSAIIEFLDAQSAGLATQYDWVAHSRHQLEAGEEPIVFHVSIIDRQKEDPLYNNNFVDNQSASVKRDYENITMWRMRQAAASANQSNDSIVKGTSEDDENGGNK